MAPTLGRLKRRADFRRVAAAKRRWAAPGLILEARPAVENSMTAPEAMRVGFTVSRKVGNAVERNRVRRRLRAAAGAVLPARAKPGHDYVVIGRRAALTRDYGDLLGDFATALIKIGAAVPAAGSP